jgi:hypothetical protein
MRTPGAALLVLKGGNPVMKLRLVILLFAVVAIPFLAQATDFCA